MKPYIGLMSGTSMDGVDAALMDVTTHQLIAGTTRPYSHEARQHLAYFLSKNEHSLASIGQLNTILGREFAAAVDLLLSSYSIDPSEVIAIGSHGQTIAHDAMADVPYTIQLACPHTISELTNMTVVADFRTRDLVIGGTGAPYAPLYHQALFAHLNESVAIVNIGGIANLTCLTKDKKASGYDIGPGNCLMDRWIQKNLAKPYDARGDWAASGKTIDSLLQSFRNDAYFKLSAPKSIGKEYFDDEWMLKHGCLGYEPVDIQATLLALTAVLIATAIQQQSILFKQVFICGGGVHNQALLMALRSHLPGMKVESIQSLGADPDYIEAMMFAWMADKALTQTPVDLTEITGARKPAILGVVYHANNSGRYSKCIVSK